MDREAAALRGKRLMGSKVTSEEEWIDGASTENLKRALETASGDKLTKIKAELKRRGQ